MLVSFPSTFFSAGLASVGYAGLAVDAAGVGSKVWTSPELAQGNNTDPSVYASAVSTGAGSTTTHYLKFTDFGFSIPALATVNSITFSFSKARTGTGTDSTIKVVVADSVVGNNLSVGGTFGVQSAPGISYEWDDYTTTPAALGVAITPAIVNSALFGCVISGTVPSKAIQLSVQACRITIRYS